MDLDHGPQGKFSPRQWTLAEFKKTIDKWQRFMYDNNGWNALYLENHDQPRAVSRFASDKPAHRANSAKLIAIIQGFQAGTPFIYQGQELGMHNVPEEWPMDEYKDVDCLNHWKYVPPLPHPLRFLFHQTTRLPKDPSPKPLTLRESSPQTKRFLQPMERQP